MRQPKLFEGLRSKDLRGYVENTFTIDQFTSKMGEDKDVVVLGFKVNDKHPAMDLMEFIEKGYPFVLDADMSSGEEKNGQYQVFVEIERNKNLPGQMRDLLSGLSHLCDNWDWRFRYHNNLKSQKFTEESIMETVPLDLDAYKIKMLESKTNLLKQFFNHSAFDSISLDENNVLTVARPYSGHVIMDLLAFGDYEEVKDSLQGGIQLDEASQSQVTFLEKYLGNYEIHKINNKFLIQNGDQAIVVSKERW